MRQYIEHGTFPSHLYTWKKRVFRLEALSYRFVLGVIFIKHHNGLLLKFLEAHDLEKVLCDLHDGPTGGHFAGDIIVHKFMQDGLYWSILFKDTHAYACKYRVCLKSVRRVEKPVNLLQAIAVEEPFQQWCLDVISDIFSHSSKKHH